MQEGSHSIHDVVCDWDFRLFNLFSRKRHRRSIRRIAVFSFFFSLLSLLCCWWWRWWRWWRRRCYLSSSSSSFSHPYGTPVHKHHAIHTSTSFIISIGYLIVNASMWSVQDLHLFEKRGFAWFSGAQQKQFQIARLHCIHRYESIAIQEIRGIEWTDEWMEWTDELMEWTNEYQSMYVIHLYLFIQSTIYLLCNNNHIPLLNAIDDQTCQWLDLLCCWIV